MTCKFLTVDVFTNERFQGAQVAIVPDADYLTEGQMQNIATELNLWRTVFILPSMQAGSCCKIRIFNHQREFDFGGHATVATIYALAELNEVPLDDGDNTFFIDENFGRVECMVTVKKGKAVFNQFTKVTKVEVDRFTPPVEELSDFLSIDSSHFHANDFTPLLITSHVPYLFVPVDNYAALSEVHFDYRAWAASSAPATFASSIFLFSMSNDNGQAHFHCRLVGPNFALHEDPPIGAAMLAFAGYLKQFNISQALPLTFVAERGMHGNRKSVINVTLSHSEKNLITVSVGGEAVLISQGELFL